jgi:hypothetical protein
MQKELGSFGDNAVATMQAKGNIAPEGVGIEGHYHVVCRDKDGNIKWEDEFPNTVVTAGKNHLLDTHFKTANVTAFTTTWYMGLIAANGYSAIAAGDTMASHAGWKESGENNASAPGYSQTTRRQITFAAAATSAKATSNAVVFSMSIAGTVKGAFIVNQSTKAGTTGTLYSAGLFTVGDKVVTAGDTLNITYTASA